MQKLELISQRFDIAGKVPEGMLDRRWVQKQVLGLTDKQIEEITEGKKLDKIEDAEVEAAGSEEGGGEEGGGEEAGGGGLFSADVPSGDQLLVAVPGDKTKVSDPRHDMMSDEDDDEDEIDIGALSIDDLDAPLKAQAAVKKYKSKSSSRGPLTTHMPDFKSMVTHSRSQDSMRKPFGDDHLRRAFEGTESSEEDTYNRGASHVRPTVTPELRGTFASLASILNPEGGVLLSEALENEGEQIELDKYDAGEIDES
jgi:hypothetical protein